jgi:hypothetical protein
MNSIEVVETTNDDPSFKEGWQVSAITTITSLAPGNTRDVSCVFNEACSIFYVTSDLEITGLVVGLKDVPLVATDHAENETREWRVHEGPVDVPAGAHVVFRVKNDSAAVAKPIITCISRALCARGST